MRRIERIANSVRDKRERAHRLQKITTTFARLARFNCLLIEFDSEGYKKSLRQLGIKDKKSIEMFTDEHWRRREAMRYATIKTAKKLPLTPEKQEEFILDLLKSTCKCLDVEYHIQHSEEFLRHLEGTNDMGVPDYYSDGYQDFLKTIHPVWVYDDTPYGLKNTLSPNKLNKLLSKVRHLTFPPKIEPVPDEPPLSDYERLLQRQPEKIYKKVFEEKRKESQKKWKKEKPKKISQTEIIADILGTTMGTIRKDKQRLKRWNML